MLQSMQLRQQTADEKKSTKALFSGPTSINSSLPSSASPGITSEEPAWMDAPLSQEVVLHSEAQGADRILASTTPTCLNPNG